MNELESSILEVKEENAALKHRSKKDLDEAKQSIDDLKSEITTLKKNKGNAMASTMQKQMIAALREENNMLKE